MPLAILLRVCYNGICVKNGKERRDGSGGKTK